MSDRSLIERCYRLGWTDGLPVVPPSPARVIAMIRVSGRDSDEVVARLGPAPIPATVEKVAANAVMAGCLPEYFPVVLAAVAAESGWGPRLLGGFEDVLTGPGRTFQRIAGSPSAASFPEPWASSQVGKVDHAVTAVGD